ncbi:unnamed protein product, partial [Haemonchus placei]|uniref:Sigma-54 factor interaction domain-containing protein n=1 Tax=Haemonchus placei TaxID=6290 RepID=A0A0N4WFC8_HAEPC
MIQSCARRNSQGFVEPKMSAQLFAVLDDDGIGQALASRLGHRLQRFPLLFIVNHSGKSETNSGNEP